MNSKRVMAALLAAAFAFPAAAVAGPGAPKGWIIAGSAPADYEFGTEHVDGSAGKQSAYIKAKPNASPGGFGTVLSQNAWLPVFKTLGAELYSGGRLLVSRAVNVFDAEGRVADAPTRDAIAKFMAGFVQFVQRRR